MPCHRLLPRRRPFIFLNQRHSLPRARARAYSSLREEDDVRATSIEATCIEDTHVRVRDDRPAEEETAATTRDAPRDEEISVSDGQVQLTRLFHTEQGALSREALVPAVRDAKESSSAVSRGTHTSSRYGI